MGLDGVVFQKTEFFITTAVRTSKSTSNECSISIRDEEFLD
jgi:hypothetical protein